jgi:hypothetical protein
VAPRVRGGVRRLASAVSNHPARKRESKQPKEQSAQAASWRLPVLVFIIKNRAEKGWPALREQGLAGPVPTNRFGLWRMEITRVGAEACGQDLGAWTGRTWDGGEGERLLDHADLGAAVVGHGGRLAGLVEAVVHVVAPDALPDPRRLVVEPSDALLQARGGRRGALGRSRRRGHRARQAAAGAAREDGRRGAVAAAATAAAGCGSARGRAGRVEQRRVSHLRRYLKGAEGRRGEGCGGSASCFLNCATVEALAMAGGNVMRLSPACE